MKKNDKREAASIDWFVDPHNEAYDEAQHDSMLYIKKFAAPPTPPNEQDVVFPVCRYVQVLLREAEAYNEPGQIAQAYPEINKVRNRAGLANLTSGLNQAAFRKAVYQEQRVESAFEDHRFQLLRTGTAIEAMTQTREQKTYPKWLLNEGYDMQA